MNRPFLVISLDFELMWGVRDKRTIASYGTRILGVRQAVPAILDRFDRHRVHATWATVGALTVRHRGELSELLEPLASATGLQVPDKLLAGVGTDEGDDPYHFGRSLVSRILDTPGMEVGSHTFSHFCCLEPMARPESFSADCEAALVAFTRLGTRPTALVFPRNEYAAEHVQIARDHGLTVFRGNPARAMYRTQAQSRESAFKRVARLTDSYFAIAGQLDCRPSVAAPGIIDVPASRFLRPAVPRLAVLEPLRLARITGEMAAAARAGSGYHLWWHPHNFGADLGLNLAALDVVLECFERLRDRFGMESLTMSEAAARAGTSRAFEAAH